MAFSRTWLKSVTKDDEMVNVIMEEHVAVVDALQQKMDSYKEQADKLPDVQKKLDDLLGGEDYKKKYEEATKALQDYKDEVASKETAAKVRAAYRKLLKDEKISDSILDDIENITDYSKMKLDKDGNLLNVEDYRKAIGDKYGRWKTTVTERGADVEKPPKTGSAKMTKADILAIEDTSERQNAIANNLELFGKG